MKSIIRAKESVLRNNLFTLRNMIDEYTVDKQKAPVTNYRQAHPFPDRLMVGQRPLEP